MVCSWGVEQQMESQWYHTHIFVHIRVSEELSSSTCAWKIMIFPGPGSSTGSITACCGLARGVCGAWATCWNWERSSKKRLLICSSCGHKRRSEWQAWRVLNCCSSNSRSLILVCSDKVWIRWNCSWDICNRWTIQRISWTLSCNACWIAWSGSLYELLCDHCNRCDIWSHRNLINSTRPWRLCWTIASWCS